MVATVRRAVAIGIEVIIEARTLITAVTDPVAVQVFLFRVLIVRAVVATVRYMVLIGVAGVVLPRALITGVTDTICIIVFLAGIGNVWSN